MSSEISISRPTADDGFRPWHFFVLVSILLATVAVILAHHGAAHFDQRRPQRVKAGDIEFRCGVKASGGYGARWRQHPIAADQFTGVLLANQQVITVLVEAVSVQTVNGAGQFESGLGGEHIVT